RVPWNGIVRALAAGRRRSAEHLAKGLNGAPDALEDLLAGRGVREPDPLGRVEGGTRDHGHAVTVEELLRDDGAGAFISATNRTHVQVDVDRALGTHPAEPRLLRELGEYRVAARMELGDHACDRSLRRLAVGERGERRVLRDRGRV